MTEEQKASGIRKVLQALALLLFLVVLPLGSWFYLRNGLDYRLEALEELGDHGVIAPFELPTYKQDTLDRKDLEGKLVVASFLDFSDETLTRRTGEYLNKLHEQFDERPDVLLLQHVLNAPDAGRIQAFELEHRLDDPDQCFFLVGGEGAGAAQVGDLYGLEATAGAPLNTQLVLADTTLTIRRYYDLRDEQAVRRMVEHIAIILPRIEERDLVFKREREK
jgi:hypothetical protein